MLYNTNQICLLCFRFHQSQTSQLSAGIYVICWLAALGYISFSFHCTFCVMNFPSHCAGTGLANNLTNLFLESSFTARLAELFFHSDPFGIWNSQRFILCIDLVEYPCLWPLLKNETPFHNLLMAGD